MKNIKAATIISLILMSSMITPRSAVALTSAEILVILGTLHGPLKDLGELLTNEFIDYQSIKVQEEIEKQTLRRCDEWHENFWTQARDGTMDEQKTARYSQIFKDECEPLWNKYRQE